MHQIFNNWDENLEKLCAALADIYPDKQDIYTILRRMNLSSTRVELGGKSFNNWVEVLHLVLRLGYLPQLRTLTDKDSHGQDGELHELFDAVQQSSITSLQEQFSRKTSFISSLPHNFVSRFDVSDEIVRILMEPELVSKIHNVPICVIYGLPGVGKSTHIADLMQKDTVDQYFRDSIYKVTIGQKPDILSKLKGLLRDLNDIYEATSIEAASNRLRELLKNKTALIVLDDVWSEDGGRVDDLKWFLVGGKRCHFLITTRESKIANTLDAASYHLREMTQEQALQLLSFTTDGKWPDEEEEIAKELAKKVGYLPLALQLVVAQVTYDGVPWKKLLEDLSEEIIDFKNWEGLEIRFGNIDEVFLKDRSLLASFNLSLRRLLPDQRKMFALLGALSDDVLLSSGMIKTLWDIDEYEAEKTLEYLARRALILRKDLGSAHQTYSLHSIQHAIARYLLTAPPASEKSSGFSGLGYKLIKVHEQLLERYAKQKKNGSWSMLPNDEYIYKYLTWHMEKAQKIDDIHALLTEEVGGKNAWYQVRESQGQVSEYLEDIFRAWRLVEEKLKASIKENAIAKGDLILGIRYSLIVSSLNSLAQNIPPTLLAMLVKQVGWEDMRGFGYALRIPDKTQRARALLKLLPLLKEQLKIKAISKLLDIINAIDDIPERIEIMTELALKLADLNLPNEALSVVSIIKELSKNGRKQAELFAELAPKLALTGNTKKLQDRIETIKNPKDYGLALLGLLPHLPKPEKEKAALAAFDTNLKFKNDWETVLLCIRIFPYLAQNTKDAKLKKLLEGIEKIVTGKYQAEVLQELLDLPSLYLSEGLSDKVLSLARKRAARGTDEDRRWSVNIQARLARHLVEQKKEDLLLYALREVVGNIGTITFRTDALIDVAEAFSDDTSKNVQNFLLYMLSIIKETDKISYIKTLLRIAYCIPILSKEEQFNALKELQDMKREDILLEVSSYLPQPLKDQLLSSIAESEQHVLRFRLSLSMALDESTLFGYMEQIPDIEERVAAFIDLMSYISKQKSAEKVDRELLNLTLGLLIEDIQECDREKQAGLIDKLACYMSKEQIEKSFRILRIIGDNISLNNVLFVNQEPGPVHTQQLELLASFFTESQDSMQAKLLDQEAAFQEIMGIIGIDTDMWLEQLISLSSLLMEKGNAQEALAINWMISDPQKRSELFSDLANKLIKTGYVHEAFVAIQGIKKSSIRNILLRRLVSKLPRSLKSDTAQEAIAAIWMLEERQSQIELLLKLASHIPENECLMILIWVSQRDGEHLLDRILAITQNITDDTWRIHILVGLLPYLSERDRRVFLAELRMIENKRYLVQILSDLIPSVAKKLKDILIEEILYVINEVDDNIWQAQILVDLVSYVPEIKKNIFIQQAINTMEIIDDRRYRSEMFFTLVDHMAVSLENVEKEKSKMARVFGSKHFDILQLLIPQLSEVLKKTILEEILTVEVEAKDRNSYTRMLIKLLLFCSLEIQKDSIIEKVLAVARTIDDDENFFASVLRQLFLHISDVQKGNVTENILAAIEESNDKGWIYHAQIIVELLPFLPDNRKESLIKSINIISGTKKQKAQILVKLSPYTQDPFTCLQQALEISGKSGMMDWCEEINKLLSCLPEARKEELADNVLLTIEQHKQKMDIFHRVKVLKELIPHFPQKKKEKAVNYALDLAKYIRRDKGKRAIALGYLMDYLLDTQKDVEIQDILESLQESSNIGSKTQALLSLLPHLSVLQQREESEKTIEAIKYMEYQVGRRVVLQAKLAEYVSAEKKETIIEDGLNILMKNWKGTISPAEVINWKGTISPAEVIELSRLGYFEQMVDATDKLEDITQQVQILLDLVIEVSSSHEEKAIQKALVAIDKISNAAKWAGFLLKLMPYLPQPLRCNTNEHMQNVVRSYPLTDKREIALEHLIKHGYIQQALAALRTIKTKEEQAQILIALLPYLPESVQKKTITHEAQIIVETIADGVHKAEMLTKLASHLSIDMQKKVVVYEALVTIKEMEDTTKQTKALIELLPHLSGMLRRVIIEQVLINVRFIENKRQSEEILILLINWLVKSNYMLKELKAVHNIKQLISPSGLASDLPEVNWSPLLLDGLRNARIITDSIKRRKVFSGLALFLKDLPLAILYLLWSEMLYTMKEYTRQDLIFDMYALLPIIASLGEREVSSQIDQAILDVRRWWP